MIRLALAAALLLPVAAARAQQPEGTIRALDALLHQAVEREALATVQMVHLSTKEDALTKERDALTKERDALTKERDALTKERDALTKQRDELKAAPTVEPPPVAPLAATVVLPGQGGITPN